MTVYFHLQSNDRVKIGFTGSTIEARRRDLQTGSGHTLVCLGGIVDGDRALEKQLQFLFSNYKIPETGEWYWAVPPVLEFIEKFSSRFCGDEITSNTATQPIYRSIDGQILTAPRATAILFLRNIFEPNGPPITGSVVTAKARACGIAKTTLRRARESLNIEVRHMERASPTDVPWYPPQTWPNIPGLERFFDVNDGDVDEADNEVSDIE